MISLLSPLVAIAMMFTAVTAGSTNNQPEPEILATSTVEKVAFDFNSEIAYLSTKYGFDEKLARRIINCESLIYGQDAENKNYRMEWSEKLGTTTRTHWSTDYGFWQVNDFWHESTANKMGYDIHDPQQNLEYGAILLSRDGTRHWNASKYCWNK